MYPKYKSVHQDNLHFDSAKEGVEEYLRRGEINAACGVTREREL